MLKLFLPVGVILCAGLLALSSISPRLFFLQLLWSGGGVILVMLLLRTNVRLFLNYRWFLWGLYCVAILLLALVLVVAPTIRNTRSWFPLGPFTIQPVELAKISLILLYAAYFSRRHVAVARWRFILTSFFLFGVPFALTAAQPDLGSATVLFGIWFGFLLMSGLPLRRTAAVLAVLLVFGLWGWHALLADYHRARIYGLFYPEENVLTVNYSVIQSKIAIGSAGLLGKGYGQGSQTQLGFLTEPATDFILAAFIEEWGILAGILLVGAFLALTVEILRIGRYARQNFEKFICLGTALMFGIHFLLNAGSTVGSIPVVGLTFPFLSYGGSSLAASFFLLSLVNAIRMRQK